MSRKKSLSMLASLVCLAVCFAIGSCGESGSSTPPPPPVGSWSTISTVDAPDMVDIGGYGVANTGTHLVMWGGYSNSLDVDLDTGYIYEFATDTWTSTTTTNAPSARYRPIVIWTGSEIIVWGGDNWDSATSSFIYLTDGYRYNIASDIWTPISTTGAPAGREHCAAIWTGTEMIIWGGRANSTYLTTGARYNPTTDTWTSITATNAPPESKELHAVYTGTQVAIIGKTVSGGNITLGYLYNPTTDTWIVMNNIGNTQISSIEDIVWTGSEIMYFGGRHSDGTTAWYEDAFFAYNPTTETWRTIRGAGAPSPRIEHCLVWTGEKYIVWGGAINPDEFDSATAVTNTGGIFDPATSTWETMTTQNAPDARADHIAQWGDGKLFIAEGSGIGSTPGAGGIFTP